MFIARPFSVSPEAFYFRNMSTNDVYFPRFAIFRICALIKTSRLGFYSDYDRGFRVYMYIFYSKRPWITKNVVEQTKMYKRRTHIENIPFDIFLDIGKDVLFRK